MPTQLRNPQDSFLETFEVLSTGQSGKMAERSKGGGTEESRRKGGKEEARRKGGGTEERRRKGGKEAERRMEGGKANTRPILGQHQASTLLVRVMLEIVF